MGTPLQKRSQVAAAGAGGWGGESNITRSAWFDGSADHLDRTPSSASTDRTRQIWSCWVRRTRFSANARGMFGAGTGASARAMLFLSTHDFYWELSGGITARSVAVFRDPEWMHFVASYDGNESTNADKLKVYFNGEQIELTFAGTLPTTPQHFGDTILHTIGSNTSVGNPMEGKLAQAFHIADKSIQNGDHAITDFGESVTVGNTTIWAPRSDAAIKALVDAGGGNSFLISSAFGDGTDDSANGNNFTPTSMSDAANGSDDTPSSPLPIFNPLFRGGGNVYFEEGAAVGGSADGSEANLLVVTPAIYSGTHVIEFDVSNSPSGSYPKIGVMDAATMRDNSVHATSGSHELGTAAVPGSYGYLPAGQINHEGTNIDSAPASFTTNDRMAIEVDLDSDVIRWYKGGVLQSTTNTAGLEAPVFFAIDAFNNADARIVAQVADMTHTPTTGYTPPQFSNFEAPTVQGADLFNPVLYQGTGVALSVTGTGFAPDSVWIKARTSSSLHHALFDTTRGVFNRLLPSDTGATGGGADTLTAFDSDGFTLSTSLTENTSGVDYVAWQWLAAGGTTTTNNDGNVTSQVQVADNGFMSIVQYTGDALDNRDIGHGLNSADVTVIVKDQDAASSWIVTFPSMTNNEFLQLESNIQAQTVTSGTIRFYRDNFTASTFQVGTYATTNTNDFIAYVFKNAPGLCQTGAYVGNGNADGPFIHTGFRPRFILLKGEIANTEWHMFDTARGEFNENSKYLEADTTAIEGSTKGMDMLANGFKLRTTSSDNNNSGTTYYYLAIADVGTGTGLPPIPGR